MEISIFQESDIDAVFGIQQAAYKPLYEKYHDDNSNPYMESKETVFRKYTRKGTIRYIFTQNEIIVGTVRINLYPESRRGRISALAVHPQYQNQGIAQQALLKIEEIHNDVEKMLKNGFLILFYRKQEIVICTKKLGI